MVSTWEISKNCVRGSKSWDEVGQVDNGDKVGEESIKRVLRQDSYLDKSFYGSYGNSPTGNPSDNILIYRQFDAFYKTLGKFFSSTSLNYRRYNRSHGNQKLFKEKVTKRLLL